MYVIVSLLQTMYVNTACALSLLFCPKYPNLIVCMLLLSVKCIVQNVLHAVMLIYIA